MQAETVDFIDFLLSVESDFTTDRVVFCFGRVTFREKINIIV